MHFPGHRFELTRFETGDRLSMNDLSLKRLRTIPPVLTSGRRPLQIVESRSCASS